MLMPRARTLAVRLWFSALAFISTGCATTSALHHSEASEWVNWPLTPRPQGALSEKKLVTRANALVGLATLKVAAPHLPDDCTGLVRAVYDDSGIELMSAAERGDNGVTAMYRLAFERSALHTQLPAPGDLVFFLDTYDRNRDGKHNDGLTHVGVVLWVDEAGTVAFAHRVAGGVKRGHLNLNAPADPKQNDYLRPAKKGQPALLTGELFAAFASASRLAGAAVRH